MKRERNICHIKPLTIGKTHYFTKKALNLTNKIQYTESHKHHLPAITIWRCSSTQKYLKS